MTSNEVHLSSTFAISSVSNSTGDYITSFVLAKYLYMTPGANVTYLAKKIGSNGTYEVSCGARIHVVCKHQNLRVLLHVTVQIISL